MSPIGWFFALLCWIGFFWLYRDYRLDSFRQKLFGLRDELFELGVAEVVDFNSMAYGSLRSLINGTITHGHRFGFFEILFAQLSTRLNSSSDEIVMRFASNWITACSELSQDGKVAVESIRRRVHLIVFEQVILTSFILITSLIAVLMGVLLKCIQRQVEEKLSAILDQKEIRRLLNAIDCASTLSATSGAAEPQ